MSRGPYYTPGKYLGKVVSQALGKTKNGNDQFVLTFVVQGKIDPADPDGALIECEKYERTVFRVFTPKTIEYIVNDLRTLGFEGGSFSLLDPETPSYHDFTGQEFAFTCEHDTYDGQEREKWGIAREGGGLKVERLDNKAIRNLDATYGMALKQNPPVTKKASPPLVGANAASNQAARATDGGGDEVPF